MRFNDSVFGVVLIVFAIADIAYAQTFPRLHGQDYGPNLFPTIIGAGFLILGAILIVRGMMQSASVPLMTIGDWAQDRNNVINVVTLIACILFYILFSTWLGFVPTSMLVLSVLLVRLGSSWPVSLAVAMTTTLVIHTLFAKILLVPLPWGLLLPIAW
jgi:putative tricarboxylic transport membrane protein